jgi:hypothetical protein
MEPKQSEAHKGRDEETDEENGHLQAKSRITSS